MSYILEALKKAELKREQEEPSKVPTFLAGHFREPVRRAKWSYVLVAVLLLNAGLVTWLLIPGRAPLPPVVTTAPVVQPALSTKPAKGIKKDNITQPETKPVVSNSAREILNVPVASGPAPIIVVEKPQPYTSTPAPIPGKPPEPPLASLSRTEKPRPAGKVLSLNELPSAIRSRLTEFRISGHAYTPEPSTRVVRVNEKILQEGQDLSPGLKLEEIIQGGIIMSYEGYRFRVNIKEN